MQTFINTWGDSNMNKIGTQACKHRPGFFEYQRKRRQCEKQCSKQECDVHIKRVHKKSGWVASIHC